MWSTIPYTNSFTNAELLILPPNSRFWQLWFIRLFLSASTLFIPCLHHFLSLPIPSSSPASTLMFLCIHPFFLFLHPLLPMTSSFLLCLHFLPQIPLLPPPTSSSTSTLFFPCLHSLASLPPLASSPVSTLFLPWSRPLPHLASLLEPLTPCPTSSSQAQPPWTSPAYSAHHLWAMLNWPWGYKIDAIGRLGAISNFRCGRRDLENRGHWQGTLKGKLAWDTDRGQMQGTLTWDSCRGHWQGTVAGDTDRGQLQRTLTGDRCRGHWQETLAGTLPGDIYRGHWQGTVTRDTDRRQLQGTLAGRVRIFIILSFSYLK